MKRFAFTATLSIFLIVAILLTINVWASSSPNNSKALILDNSKVSALNKQSSELSTTSIKEEFNEDKAIFTPPETTPFQGGDDIGSAAPITSMPASISGTTDSYTDDYQENCDGTGSSNQPDVVYSYAPAVDEYVDISLCNSSYVTNLWVYENDATTLTACNRFEPACGNPRSQLTNVEMIAGNTYYIVIDGDWQLSPGFGTYQMELSSIPVPVLHDSSYVHPALADAGNGNLILAYEDNNLDTNGIWTGSNLDGVFLMGGVFWSGHNIYPSVAYWGQDSVFYGTYVEEGTGNIHVLDLHHPTDNGLWSNSFWDYSTYGWQNLSIIDIATDDSQPFAEQPGYRFGLVSMVHNTTYTTPSIVDGPFLLYEIDGPDIGRANISWYNDMNGCLSTSINIDNTTLMSYAVYDPYSIADAQRQLFIRYDNFDDMDDDVNAGGYTYSLEPGENIQYPEVSAHDGNILVVCEYFTDTAPDDRDIICYYAPGGDVANLSTSIVMATVEDERFPRIENVFGNTFVCTYISNNVLYMVLSDDGGATWGIPEAMSDADEVVSEYHASDITEKGSKLIWEYRIAGDPDTSIFLHFGPSNLVTDSDNDGVSDEFDNCLTTANPGQEDADGDGIGDVCDDCTDTDNDGYGDPGFPANTCGLDNCPTTYNPGQEDSGSENIGDACCCIDYRGDVDYDGDILISDITFLVDYLFGGGAPPPCPFEGDADGGGGDTPVNISDLTFLVEYMFSGGIIPPNCP